MVYGYASECKTEKGFVYFIRDGLGHIKIGIARNVEKRKSGLQTANPNELETFFIMSVPSIYDAMEIEKELHKKFSKDRLKGEWFKEKEVLSYLRQNKIKTADFVFDGADW